MKNNRRKAVKKTREVPKREPQFEVLSSFYSIGFGFFWGVCLTLAIILYVI